MRPSPAVLALALVVLCCTAPSTAVPAEVGFDLWASFNPQDFGVGPDVEIAARIAVDEVNSDARVLPDTRLRMTVRDSGCSARQALALLFEVLPAPPAFVVGTSCAGAADYLGLPASLPAVRLPVITYSATRPSLTGPDRDFFSMAIPSDAKQAAAWAALAAHFGWRRVGLVLEVSQNLAFLNPFAAACHALGITIELAETTALGNLDTVMARFAALELRVFFMDTSETGAYKVLDAAHRAGLLRAGYAWVGTDNLAGLRFWEFEVEGATLSSKEVLAHSQGLIITSASPGEGAVYDKYIEKFTAQSNRTGTDYFGPYAYDTVHLCVRALHDVLYTQGVDRGADAFPDAFLAALRAAEFDGATGLVSLDEDGLRKGSIITYLNLQGDKWVLIGTWHEDTGAMQAQQGSALLFPGRTHTVPADSPELDYANFEASDAGGVAILTVLGVGMLTIACSAAILLAWYNHPVMRYSSQPFLAIILVGAFLSLLSGFFWLGELHTWKCTLTLWLLPVGLVLILAPMLTKNFRVWRIVSRSNSFKRIRITNTQLAAFVGGCLAVQLALSAVWTAVEPPTGRDVLDGFPEAHYECHVSLPFLLANVAYLLVLVLACLVLSFLTRDVMTDFNESRVLAFLVYNFLVMGVIMVLLTLFVPDEAAGGHTVARVLVLVLCTVGTVAMVFGQKLFHILAGTRWGSTTKESNSPTSPDSKQRRSRNIHTWST